MLTGVAFVLLLIGIDIRGVKIEQSLWAIKLIHHLKRVITRNRNMAHAVYIFWQSVYFIVIGHRKVSVF